MARSKSKQAVKSKIKKGAPTVQAQVCTKSYLKSITERINPTKETKENK